MQLTRHRKDWEELAVVDPLWAILSEPGRRFRRWDEAAFFRTGVLEIDALMAEAKQLRHPSRWHSALDFGCGVGRLTKALRAYFPECHGVDISSEMVAMARRLSPECVFHVNTEANLKLFEDSFFDFIYSVIVLQHLPSSAVVLAYITDFLRILRQGGLLVFQLPYYIKLRNRIQGRRRLYALLQGLGLSSNVLYGRLKLTPIRMIWVSERDVLAAVRRSGGKVLDVRPDNRAGGRFPSKTYYVSR